MEALSQQDQFLIFIDSLRVEDGGAAELLVSGWAANKRFEPFDSVEIDLGSLRLPLRTCIAREDVASRFNSVAMAKPGFAGRFYLHGSAGFFRLFGRDSDGETLLLTVPIPESTPIPGYDSAPNSYPNWLRRFETGLFWDHREVAAKIAGLPQQPLISVIVPTFNTDPYHLYRCVHSLLMQHYRNWQLCISDDGSRDEATLNVLRGLTAVDPRICVRLNTRNAGISAASMAAAEMAEGEFILLLDHDDELHRHALVEVARQVNLTPDVDLIYSDEDKINELGERCAPAFKPGFDPEMLLAFSYIGHIVCVRSGVFRAVGGLRSSADGAQDWDLLIRISEAVAPERVAHIPKPLYHWRMHPESTSQDLDAKPFSQSAWQRVLEDCLRRREIPGKVERGLFLGSMRIRRQVPAGIRTAVILRMEDGNRQLAIARRARLPQNVRFYESFLSTVHDLETSEIVLASEDLAVDIVLFLNIPLDRLNHFFYEELISQCARPSIGMAGGVTLDLEANCIGSSVEVQQDGTLWNIAEGMNLTALGYLGRLRVVHAVASVAPYFFAVRSSVLAGAGGLSRLQDDSGVSFCRALAAECHRQDLRVLFTPFAVATAITPLEPLSGWKEGVPAPPALRLNPNLAALPDVAAALQYGV